MSLWHVRLSYTTYCMRERFLMLYLVFCAGLWIICHTCWSMHSPHQTHKSGNRVSGQQVSPYQDSRFWSLTDLLELSAGAHILLSLSPLSPHMGTSLCAEYRISSTFVGQPFVKQPLRRLTRFHCARGWDWSPDQDLRPPRHRRRLPGRRDSRASRRDARATFPQGGRGSCRVSSITRGLLKMRCIAS